jgi:hypothetical protein
VKQQLSADFTAFSCIVGQKVSAYSASVQLYSVCMPADCRANCRAKAELTGDWFGTQASTARYYLNDVDETWELLEVPAHPISAKPQNNPTYISQSTGFGHMGAHMATSDSARLTCVRSAAVCALQVLNKTSSQSMASQVSSTTRYQLDISIISDELGAVESAPPYCRIRASIP